MELSGLDAALSTLTNYDISGVDTSSLAYAVGVKMLDQTMEATETMNQQMIRAMEQSVTPHLGGTIDTYV